MVNENHIVVEDIAIIQQLKEDVNTLCLNKTYAPKVVYGMKYEDWIVKSERFCPFIREDELGIVYVLLRRMKEKGADVGRIIRIVKYGMVIVDADFYILDWWQAYEDLGIRNLWKEYCDDIPMKEIDSYRRRFG